MHKGRTTDSVAVCVVTDKYEEDAAKSWDKFYKRNSTNFYKDQHYLHLVFEDLTVVPQTEEKRTLLEVGSGVGNAALPLLEINPALNIVAIDFADSAIDLLKVRTRGMFGCLNEVLTVWLARVADTAFVRHGPCVRLSVRHYEGCTSRRRVR